VTAAKSWSPTPTETVGREDDYQVAAPTEREHPPSTERISLTKECGWKDGDRGGLAEWEQTHGKKKERRRKEEGKKKVKVCLDINRPSHGRTWETEPLAGVYTRWSGFTESVWPSTSCGSLGLLTSQNTIPRARAAPAKAAMTLGVVW
jgi:hypothetical protein